MTFTQSNHCPIFIDSIDYRTLEGSHLEWNNAMIDMGDFDVSLYEVHRIVLTLYELLNLLLSPRYLDTGFAKLAVA